MGFLHDLFSGTDDAAMGQMGALDDLGRFDFSGFEDRQEDQISNIMENDALRTVGLPIADYFSFGLTSPAVRAKYNKMQTGKSGFNLGDFGKSVAGNYIAGEFLPASSGGGMSNLGYNVAAGAGRGAISQGIQGNSMTEGAKAGATGGGVMGLGSYLGDLFRSRDDASYVPSTSGQAIANESTQSSQVPQERADYFKPEGSTAPQQSTAPSYAKSGSPGAYDYSAPSSSSGLGSQFTEFMSSLLPNSPTGTGDMAQGLLGMYSGYRRQRAAKELRNQIGGNRGSYETALRNNLQRRDAASGRRSNYGGREVELQAALAQLDSRNAPALSQLNDARYSGLESMMRSGLNMGGNMGWFGSQYQRPDPGLRFRAPPIQNLSSMYTPQPMEQSGTLGNMRRIPGMPEGY